MAEYGFTDREKYLLKFVLEGDSNQEISEKTHISQKGVKWHLGNMFRKCQVTTRTKLMAKLLKKND